MTANKNRKSYDKLRETSEKIQEEIRDLEFKVEEILEEQSQHIIGKLNDLKIIGNSVFRKCFSNFISITEDQKQDIMGIYGWIFFGRIKLKRAGKDRINLSKMVYRYSDKAWKEESTFTVPRSLLHMSDRDFAKAIRSRIKIWKRAQVNRKVTLLKLEIEKSQNETRRATEELEKLQGKSTNLL